MSQVMTNIHLILTQTIINTNSHNYQKVKNKRTQKHTKDRGAHKMAQLVRVLAAKPEHHILIPGSHAVDGGNYMRSSPSSLCPPLVRFFYDYEVISSA